MTSTYPHVVNYIWLSSNAIRYYESWLDNSAEAVEIVEWCCDYCKGRWDMNAGIFYFEDDKDAMLFTLRWL